MQAIVGSSHGYERHGCIGIRLIRRKREHRQRRPVSVDHQHDFGTLAFFGLAIERLSVESIECLPGMLRPQRVDARHASNLVGHASSL